MFGWFKSVLSELRGIHDELRLLRMLMNKGVQRSKESEDAVNQAQKVLDNFLNMIPKPKAKTEADHGK